MFSILKLALFGVPSIGTWPKASVLSSATGMLVASRPGSPVPCKLTVTEGFALSLLVTTSEPLREAKAGRRKHHLDLQHAKRTKVERAGA